MVSFPNSGLGVNFDRGPVGEHHLGVDSRPPTTCAVVAY